MGITKYNRENRTKQQMRQLWNEIDHGPSPSDRMIDFALVVALLILFTAAIWLPILVDWIDTLYRSK